MFRAGHGFGWTWSWLAMGRIGHWLVWAYHGCAVLGMGWACSGLAMTVLVIGCAIYGLGWPWTTVSTDWSMGCAVHGLGRVLSLRGWVWAGLTMGRAVHGLGWPCTWQAMG